MRLASSVYDAAITMRQIKTTAGRKISYKRCTRQPMVCGWMVSRLVGRSSVCKRPTEAWLPVAGIVNRCLVRMYYYHYKWIPLRWHHILQFFFFFFLFHICHVELTYSTYYLLLCVRISASPIAGANIWKIKWRRRNKKKIMGTKMKS